MKLLVNLYSTVHSFSGQAEHFQEIFSLFGEDQCVFARSNEEFLEHLPQAECLICWSFSTDLYDLAKNLTLVVTPAAGRDWIEQDPRQQVQVEFSSFHGPMIAESFLGMLTYFNNQFPKQVVFQKRQLWNRNACEGRRLLRNQSLMILGCGNIGLHCGELATRIGMRVCGANRLGVGEGNFPCLPLNEAMKDLRSYDHVLSLLPGSEENEKILGDEFFKVMKSGANFYNFGRGTVLDEDELIHYLDECPTAFAGLDVAFEEPAPLSSDLYTHEQVLLTPHNSCTYKEYLDLFIVEFKSRFELGHFPSLVAK
ncbi:NAD(P)-dependent oxidoreductase [Lentisphaera profundi]|uniref:NAD(P)-dependent oxidoreductase n=1 Tax=Lentisphaera profundi TaxID=1658616 RepID=A0ABY7VWZ7_9BACT|nr:NAD(P)-dependent oxidoreductase [Lentisphaera profundi]WDE98765.1 NAD(P)-dependent oxidoreductase [Lentisphaera profundi]